MRDQGFVEIINKTAMRDMPDTYDKDIGSPRTMLNSFHALHGDMCVGHRG